MSDKKQIAIALGTAVGIVTVAACVGMYVSKHHNEVEADVNDVFEQAKQTVKKLDEAVEMLRKSTASQ